MAAYIPTCHLRVVLTQAEHTLNAFGSFIGGATAPRLQQLWEAQCAGDEDQWRDVPLVVLPHPSNAALELSKERK